MYVRYSNVHIQCLHAWEQTSRVLNPDLTSRKHILKVSGPSTKGDLYNSPCTLDILNSNLHIQSLHAWEHTSIYSKPWFNVQEAYHESFRSFYQRSPLEKSVHVRYSNVHIESLLAWEHTSRYSKPCFILQEASPESFMSFYQMRDP